MATYLVREYQTFWDPHGSGDQGEVKVFISDLDCYRYMADAEREFSSGSSITNKYLQELLDDTELEEDDDSGEMLSRLQCWINYSSYSEDNLCGQDGYNCETYSYAVKEITPEEATKYQKIIDDYKTLLQRV